MGENHFAKALHNFTMDTAAGDSIRHLTDRGYTPVQIKESLTFPAPMEYIAKVMWDHLIATRRILLDDPHIVFREGASDDTGASSVLNSGYSGGYEIVEQYDEYGRRSFLRVKKESPEEMIFSPEDYVVCDYAPRLAKGEEFDNDFISYLPGPSGPVWVLKRLI